MSKVYTVGELIEHLKKMDPSLPVGAIGHYGEIIHMREYQFSKRKVFRYEGSKETVIEVLSVEAPNIVEPY